MDPAPATTTATNGAAPISRKVLSLIRYSVAVCAVGGGLALRLALGSVLGSTVPYITFFPAVMLAAWFGGLGPGILAAALSLLTAYFFALEPSSAPGLAHATGAILFIAVSGFISILTEALRRARARSEERLRQISRETARRTSAEQALAESKFSAERDRDLLRVTLSSIGDAVIATDAAGHITFLNAIAERLTGWSDAEAVGKTISDVFVIRNEKTELPVASPVETAIRQGVIVGLANHTILIDRNGRRIPIEDSASPIRDERQRLLGVVLVFRDVTHRRESENAIRGSEERLKLALEAGKIGVWDWDVVQNRIEWSDLVYDIHGVERGAFGGSLDDFVRLIHHDDRERVAQAVRQALEHGVPYETEFRVVHRNGKVHWVSTTAHVFRNENSEPIRMLGATTGITARKEAELDLRRQWHTFDTALSNTPDFTYIFDRDGRFTYINRALLSLLQRSFEDTVGKDFLDLGYPPELATRLQRQIQQVIDTRKPLRDHTPFTGPTGETRHYEYIFVPVLAAGGQVESVAGSTRDVTEIKQIEEDLKSSNQELKRVNRELEEFAYVASHDLQEPLRTVNVYTQLILREIGGEGEKLNQYSGFIHQAVARMEALIRDLLTFSHAAQASEAPAGVADLSRSFAEALSLLKNDIDANAAVIAADSLPMVPGDTSQMTHVFQNLISNALKYRNKEVPPQIRVSVEPDGGRWVISVRDNGIGFDQRYADRIFGLFKRLHTREYPGTGLGLAICKRIVERHGGRIWADGCLPGGGAAFYFSLPPIRPMENVLLP
jgi:PAS domain S-box-containing protein